MPDFKHPKYRISTELLKYLWKQVIEWSLVTKVLSKTKLNFCILCLSKKLYVIKSLNDPNLLNKKSELVNTGRHQSNLLLKSFKRNQIVIPSLLYTYIYIYIYILYTFIYIYINILYIYILYIHKLYI